MRGKSFRHRFVTGAIAFVAMLYFVPSLAFASDLTSYINQLPPAIRTSLPASFLTSPTTANLATLTQSQINSIFNNLPTSALTTLPSDTFSSFTSGLLSSTLNTVNTSVLGNLTSSLTNLSTATLTSTLNSLTGTALSSLSSSLSGLSSGTLTSVLSGLTSTTLSGLSSSLFSGMTDATITSILNGLSGTALSSLSGALSSLTSTSLQSIISGLSSSLISSLPSTLFSSLTGTDLNSLLSNLLSSGFDLSTLSTSLFSGLSSSVLSSLSAPILSALSPAVQSLIGSITGLGLGIPGFGLFVPVYDVGLNLAFSQYMTAFNTYTKTLFQKWDNTFGAATPNGTTDSLRDLIAGSNPQGIAAKDCAVGDTEYIAYADGVIPPDDPGTPQGPWYRAAATSSGFLPFEVPVGGADGTAVQVNVSNSLRCLLKEMVGWQKLGLSIQIHTLLKQYIADAQTKQLNDRLMNSIAQINLEWAKQGNKVQDGATIYNTPVYVTNISENQYNVANRQLEEAADEAGNDPASGSPQGSWGVCEPWRLDTVADMVRSNRNTTEDPYKYTTSVTKCDLTTGDDKAFNDANDYAYFMDDFNSDKTPTGGVFAFDAITSDAANNPIWSAWLANDIASGRIDRQLDITKQKESNSGFVPTTYIDPSDPANPHGVDEQFGMDVSPADQNERMVTDQARQGDQQVADGNTLDSIAGSPAETESVLLNTGASPTGGGLYGYDTTPATSVLASSSVPVDKLIQELYDTIEYGYYGIDDGCGNGVTAVTPYHPCNSTKSLNTPDVTEWAQATMLSIYDQMKFNNTQPEVDITNKQADDPLTWY